MYIYMYVYTYMYIYIHTHTHKIIYIYPTCYLRTIHVYISLSLYESQFPVGVPDLIQVPGGFPLVAIEAGKHIPHLPGD